MLPSTGTEPTAMPRTSHNAVMPIQGPGLRLKYPQPSDSQREPAPASQRLGLGWNSPSSGFAT